MLGRCGRACGVPNDTATSSDFLNWDGLSVRMRVIHTGRTESCARFSGRSEDENPYVGGVLARSNDEIVDQ